MRRKESRRGGHGERERVCCRPSHWLWLVLIVQDNSIIHLRHEEKTNEERALFNLRNKQKAFFLSKTKHTRIHAQFPTMLCVNVEMFCVELSGIRRTRLPSLGRVVTANTTEGFLLMSLTSLVMAWSSSSEIGVTEPLKGEKDTVRERRQWKFLVEMDFQ